MEAEKKIARYQRLFKQLEGLLDQSTDPDARMATIVAVLHHKIDYFSWTGFYFVKNGHLTVRNYQGHLACQVLKINTGVCWAAINQQKIMVVPDVHQFPGHIACDSHSKSEIVVPVKNPAGEIIGVLDVDSNAADSFDDADAEWLGKIHHPLRLECLFP